MFENTVRNLFDSAAMRETSNCSSAQKNLSIYDFNAHWSKYLDEDSSEAPPSDDSDSSGTHYAIQTLEVRRLQKEDYNVLRECQRLQDEQMAETKQLYKPNHPSKQMRQNPS